MKIAYLILAHDSPRHLERLIKSISSKNCGIFIHIDLKACIDDYQKIVAENVIFIEERVPVYWGDFSIVDATLRLLQKAFQNGQGFNYYVLLSGGDYPLQPVSYVESFLEKNKGKEFINLVQMPCIPAGKPLSRLTQYKHGPNDWSLPKLFRRGLVKLGLVSNLRDYQAGLQGLTPFAGSQWWGVTEEACEYILRFVETNPKIVNFYRHAMAPDEMFFQTIIGNSALRANVARNFTYTDWSSGGPSPADLTEDHIERFDSGLPVILDDIYGIGEALFARKFTDNSVEIIRKLDSLRKEKEDQNKFSVT